MNGYTIYVNDTETTGKIPEQCDTIEISMIRLNLESFEFDQNTWYLKALNPAAIEDEALRINGHKREDILWLTKAGKEKYQEPSIVLPQIEEWIMKDEVSILDRVFVGHNPDFDKRALQSLWQRLNCFDSFPFDLEKGNHMLDTKQLAIFIDMCLGNRRQYYNLSSLIKAFGVKKGKAHQASEDTRMTADFLVTVIKGLREAAKQAFKDCNNE